MCCDVYPTPQKIFALHKMEALVVSVLYHYQLYIVINRRKIYFRPSEREHL